VAQVVGAKQGFEAVGPGWLSLRSSRGRCNRCQKPAKPINGDCLWPIYEVLLRLAMGRVMKTIIVSNLRPRWPSLQVKDRPPGFGIEHINLSLSTEVRKGRASCEIRSAEEKVFS
jgi:hypothetical protein